MDFDDDLSSGHFSSRFRQHDPAAGVPGAAPNFSRVLIPEILTYSGRNSAFANVFRNPDQAIRESLENARFMRNDPSIMECLEARQRAVALLHWHIEPEDQENPHHKRLADDMTDVLSRIPRFTEYRRNLLEAIWYGRHACQNVFALANIKGQQRVIVYRWLPVHGDKLVFRWDDGTGRYVDGQVGVRTTTLGPLTDPLAGDRVTEMSDQGPAYFFKPWERSMLTVHKHIIEDGAYEDALSAGRIHGVGIRDRIYWCWFQKQETMAQLMEVIERTGTGFTIYYYEYGNPASKAAVREVAENQTKSNIILMPRAPGDEHSGPPMQRIEPNTAAINTLQQIVHEFFEHQIKRYIMGQILSSESASTGLGSGVADLHQDTFYQIVNADAVNLEETITTELLAPLTRYNFPVSADNVRLYFRLNTKDAQAQQRLAAYKTGWEMGLKIKAADVYDVIGASLPKRNDEVLSKAHDGGTVPKSPDAKSATVAEMPAGALGISPQPLDSDSESPEQYEKHRVRYYRPDQARVPKGSPDGGEFMDEGKGTKPPGKSANAAGGRAGMRERSLVVDKGRRIAGLPTSKEEYPPDATMHERTVGPDSTDDEESASTSEAASPSPPEPQEERTPRVSDETLNDRYQEGLRGVSPPHDQKMTPEEQAAYDAGSKESFRIGERIRFHQSAIESARKALQQGDLSAGQQARAEREIARRTAAIDALNVQRNRHEKYVNKTPYKYHSTVDKLGVIIWKMAEDKEKIIDALVDAIKGKIEGPADLEQLREIAEGIAKKLLKKLLPGVGAAQAAGEAGAALIELGGELYSFKLNLDAAQTEKDLDDAADQLRHGLANVLVDKAWDFVVGKIKGKVKKAGRKLADGIVGGLGGGDAPPAAGSPPQDGGKAGRPAEMAHDPPGGKDGDLQAGIGNHGGGNAQKPLANAGGNPGPKGPQGAGKPPIKPPIVVPGDKRKKDEDDDHSDAAPKGKYRGGRHGETKGPKGDGLESHHMPAASVNGLPRNDGPAIQMEPEDHAKTGSHGSNPDNPIYRA